jgi:hypothetical protein
MTHERSDRVLLPADEPRCEPEHAPCVIRGRCARYHAAVPSGSTVRDYTTEDGGGTALCAGFIGLWYGQGAKR